MPAVLRAKGVLKLSEELSNILDAGEELPSGPHERALRAAAVVACDKIVALSAASAAGTALAATSVSGEAAAGTSSGDQKVHSGEGSTVATPFNAVQLGAYLVSLAEDNEELRGVIKPHLTKCFAY